MKLLHTIDPVTGLYLEDIIYEEEWQYPELNEDGTQVDPEAQPVLLNPIKDSDGLVDTQPIGFYSPKWDFDNKVWVEDNVEAVLRNDKQTKLNELKQAYDTANQLDIEYMDTAFQAGEDDQNLIVSVLSAGGLPDGFYWLDSLNNQVEMTYEELQGLSATIVTRGQLNFVKYQGLKGQVNEATTTEGLEAITW